MRHKIIIALIAVITIITNSCKDNGTGPEPLEPGRRDYVWSVDTLNPGHESLYMLRIAGSSASDVWAVGASSWTATSIWHYNGEQWRCDSIPRKISPAALYVASSNEVWLGNRNSIIWKYNGSQWQQYGEYKIKDYDDVTIQYFDGTSNTNIYGVGLKYLYKSDTTRGIIQHYNGITWQYINIPDIWVNFESVAIENQSGVLIISGTVYDPSGFIAKVYSWDGGTLKELLSGSGWSFVTKLGDEIFATLGSKIYKYSDKQLILWKDNTGINGNIICGRSRNDFFIGAPDGIEHFNGSDFSIVYKNPQGHNVQIIIGTIFEKDVFFIANDFTSNRNSIIHGKLK